MLYRRSERQCHRKTSHLFMVDEFHVYSLIEREPLEHPDPKDAKVGATFETLRLHFQPSYPTEKVPFPFEYTDQKYLKSNMPPKQWKTYATETVKACKRANRGMTLLGDWANYHL